MLPLTTVLQMRNVSTNMELVEVAQTQRTGLGLECRLAGSGALSYFFPQSLKVKEIKAAGFKMATSTTD